MSALYFYGLNDTGGTLVKTIIGGEVFLQYDELSNRLVYLVNNQQQDTMIQQKQKSIMEKPGNPVN